MASMKKTFGRPCALPYRVPEKSFPLGMKVEHPTETSATTFLALYKKRAKRRRFPTWHRICGRCKPHKKSHKSLKPFHKSLIINDLRGDPPAVSRWYSTTYVPQKACQPALSRGKKFFYFRIDNRPGRDPIAKSVPSVKRIGFSMIFLE